MILQLWQRIIWRADIFGGIVVKSSALIGRQNIGQKKKFFQRMLVSDYFLKIHSATFPLRMCSAPLLSGNISFYVDLEVQDWLFHVLKVILSSVYDFINSA